MSSFDSRLRPFSNRLVNKGRCHQKQSEQTLVRESCCIRAERLENEPRSNTVSGSGFDDLSWFQVTREARARGTSYDNPRNDTLPR